MMETHRRLFPGSLEGCSPPVDDRPFYSTSLYGPIPPGWEESYPAAYASYRGDDSDADGRERNASFSGRRGGGVPSSPGFGTSWMPPLSQVALPRANSRPRSMSSPCRTEVQDDEDDDSEAEDGVHPLASDSGDAQEGGASPGGMMFPMEI